MEKYLKYYNIKVNSFTTGMTLKNLKELKVYRINGNKENPFITFLKEAVVDDSNENINCFGKILKTIDGFPCDFEMTMGGDPTGILEDLTGGVESNNASDKSFFGLYAGESTMEIDFKKNKDFDFDRFMENILCIQEKLIFGVPKRDLGLEVMNVHDKKDVEALYNFRFEVEKIKETDCYTMIFSFCDKKNIMQIVFGESLETVIVYYKKDIGHLKLKGQLLLDFVLLFFVDLNLIDVFYKKYAMELVYTKHPIDTKKILDYMDETEHYHGLWKFLKINEYNDLYFSMPSIDMTFKISKIFNSISFQFNSGGDIRDINFVIHSLLDNVVEYFSEIIKCDWVDKDIVLRYSSLKGNLLHMNAYGIDFKCRECQKERQPMFLFGNEEDKKRHIENIGQQVENTCIYKGQKFCPDSKEFAYAGITLSGMICSFRDPQKGKEELTFYDDPLKFISNLPVRIEDLRFKPIKASVNFSLNCFPFYGLQIFNLKNLYVNGKSMEKYWLIGQLPVIGGKDISCIYFLYLAIHGDIDKDWYKNMLDKPLEEFQDLAEDFFDFTRQVDFENSKLICNFDDELVENSIFCTKDMKHLLLKEKNGFDKNKKEYSFDDFEIEFNIDLNDI